jgi:hypothetical protein
MYALVLLAPGSFVVLSMLWLVRLFREFIARQGSH